MNSLGALVVSLGLNSAEFKDGLTKAQAMAQQFAQNLGTGLRAAGALAVTGLAAMATAATAALGAIDQLAKQAGNFKDLEEITGANAEALASFAVSAAVAGVEMQTLADASVKLTKSLVGVDDESKAAGAALAALGIPIKEFKQLDPATQLETVAKKFGEFADGSEKAAVAVALFGKSGAALLPFFKELAAAGGRQVILSQKQIEQADEYADKQARLRAEINLYAQSIATQMLPAINSALNVIKEMILEFVNVDKVTKELRDSKAIADFAENAILVLAAAADQVDAFVRTFRIAGNVIGATAAQLGALASGDLAAYNAIQKDAEETLARIINKEGFRARLAKRFADDRRNEQIKSQEDRGFDPFPKPKLKFTGAEKEAKGAKEKISEGQRYIENLQKQIEKTEELNNVDQLWRDFSLGRIKEMTNAQFIEALGLARLLDAHEAMKKELEEGKKAWDDETKAILDNLKAQGEREKQALDDAQREADLTDALRDEIAVILGGEHARKALEKARLDSAIFIKEETLALRIKEGASKKEIEAMQESIKFMKERRELLDGKDLANQMVEEARVIADFQAGLFDIAASALENVIVNGGKAKDVLKAVEKELLSFLTRAALLSIRNTLFGGPGSSGIDIFSILGKMFANFMGGSAGGGGVAGIGGFSGGGFGEHFAMGGVSRGGIAMVGEHGPEAVELPVGARVTPNHNLDKIGGTTFNITVPVMPGATTASARQQAALIRDAVTTSIKER